LHKAAFTLFHAGAQVAVIAADAVAEPAARAAADLLYVTVPMRSAALLLAHDCYFATLLPQDRL
jgi:hypothetical protein